ncbi:hypothetical protein DFJ77DRAFT_513927 [Powellomyces hirtus]|nr:hypothetical protein DFJ77DRAFT_513927 [Powellomyces hirtus]
MTSISNVNLPAEVVSKIVDNLWDHILLQMDTQLYLNLLRLNRTFRMMAERHRKDLMRAYAAIFNTSASTRLVNRFKNPLSNPLVKPRVVLYELCRPYLEPVLGHYAIEVIEPYDIVKLVLDNAKLFDSMISTSEYPIFLQSGDGMRSSASVGVMTLYPGLPHDSDQLAFLFKNVIFIFYETDRVVEERWPYGVAFHCHDGYTFYGFKRDNNGDPEYALETFKYWNGNLNV